MIAAMPVLALSFFAPFLAQGLGFVLSLLYTVLDRLVSLAAVTPGIPIFNHTAEISLSLGIAGLCVILGKRHKQLRNSIAPFT
jgi:hypothetical protein